MARGWSFGRALGLFVAALVPFGTLFTDGDLKREDGALLASPAAD
jgi:hypothetical protein